MIRSRPVKARATLTIRLFASVPLFVNRRRSNDGTRGDQLLGQLHLERVGADPGAAAGDLSRRCLDDPRIGVAVDERGRVVREVDVAVAVRVDQLLAMCLDEERRERLERDAEPGVAAGQDVHEAPVELGRARTPGDVRPPRPRGARPRPLRATRSCRPEPAVDREPTPLIATALTGSAAAPGRRTARRRRCPSAPRTAAGPSRTRVPGARSGGRAAPRGRRRRRAARR